MKDARKSGRTRAAADTSAEGFTDEERRAMRERARELTAGGRRGGMRAGKADGEGEVLAKIAEMPAPDRNLAEQLHAIVRSSAPSLSPKLWYGMPAYARDGKVVCFFQAASKFGTRYATFGFQHDARLDDGAMWPVAFALTDLTPADEARLAALVQQAAGERREVPSGHSEGPKEIRPGLFVSNVHADSWVPDPEMAGAEMHELFADDTMWAGLLRVTGEERSGTITYPVRDMFLVLEGTCRLELDDGTTLDLGPGSVAAIPPGTTAAWHFSVPYRELWVRATNGIGQGAEATA